MPGTSYHPWSRPGPAIIEAVVDPNEPPDAAEDHRQAGAHFAEALAKGTPHGGRIALTVLADKVKESQQDQVQQLAYLSTYLV